MLKCIKLVFQTKHTFKITSRVNTEYACVTFAFSILCAINMIISSIRVFNHHFGLFSQNERLVAENSELKLRAERLVEQEVLQQAIKDRDDAITK